MRLFAFTGRAGVGKSWAARQMEEAYGAIRVSFAEPLRTITQAVFPEIADAVARYGYAEAKVRYPEMRPLMQRLGMAIRATLTPNPWITTAMAEVDQYLGQAVVVVVDDCRFADEAVALAERGALFLHIDGAGTLGVDSPEALHESEGFVPDDAFRFEDSTSALAYALRLLEEN